MYPCCLVFIDACSVVTNMAKRFGRVRRGQRPVAEVPHGHWKTPTFTAALRYDGPTAPMVLDGPIGGNRLSDERRCLPYPHPASQRHGAERRLCVCMPVNLDAHKRPGLRKAVEAVGAELWYLRAYSPDLNPIEQAFAKLKALLRKEPSRTVHDLWRAQHA